VFTGIALLAAVTLLNMYARKQLNQEPNPTIASYNASVAQIYN
jgi:hypothetical protein